jgi:hypothetical protein
MISFQQKNLQFAPIAYFGVCQKTTFEEVEEQSSDLDTIDH